MHMKFKILMLVRHGQSTGNVDQPTHDHASIPLTALGEEQAKKLSARIDVRPDLIVVSSFRRAQQTAEPLREKFPDVPVEIWPDTAEFTYLSPARCRGTRRTERLPWVKAYWQKQDPRYCDGAGAETFHNLVARATLVLQRVEERRIQLLPVSAGGGEPDAALMQDAVPGRGAAGGAGHALFARPVHQLSLGRRASSLCHG